MSIFKLSPSSLSLMHDCPRCFWLKFNRKWNRPRGIFPSLPSGMDVILKKHFDKFRDKGHLPPELRKNKECEGMKLFGITKEEKDLLEKWRNWRKGLQMEDKEGNILQGAIDNLMLNNHGKLVILDYKTRGFDLKEDTHEHYRDQLNIYSLLLQRNNFEIEEFNFLIFYIPKEVLETGEVLFDKKLVRIKADPNSAQKLFEKALALLKGKCPPHHNEKLCSWCALVHEE